MIRWTRNLFIPYKNLKFLRKNQLQIFSLQSNQFSTQSIGMNEENNGLVRGSKRKKERKKPKLECKDVPRGEIRELIQRELKYFYDFFDLSASNETYFPCIVRQMALLEPLVPKMLESDRNNLILYLGDHWQKIPFIQASEILLRLPKWGYTWDQLPVSLQNQMETVIQHHFIRFHHLNLLGLNNYLEGFNQIHYEWYQKQEYIDGIFNSIIAMYSSSNEFVYGTADHFTKLLHNLACTPIRENEFSNELKHKIFQMIEKFANTFTISNVLDLFESLSKLGFQWNDIKTIESLLNQSILPRLIKLQFSDQDTAKLLQLFNELNFRWTENPIVLEAISRQIEEYYQNPTSQRNVNNYVHIFVAYTTNASQFYTENAHQNMLFSFSKGLTEFYSTLTISHLSKLTFCFRYFGIFLEDLPEEINHKIKELFLQQYEEMNLSSYTFFPLLSKNRFEFTTNKSFRKNFFEYIEQRLSSSSSTSLITTEFVDVLTAFVNFPLTSADLPHSLKEKIYQVMVSSSNRLSLEQYFQIISSLKSLNIRWNDLPVTTQESLQQKFILILKKYQQEKQHQNSQQQQQQQQQQKEKEEAEKTIELLLHEFSSLHYSWYNVRNVCNELIGVIGLIKYNELMNQINPADKKIEEQEVQQQQQDPIIPGKLLQDLSCISLLMSLSSLNYQITSDHFKNILKMKIIEELPRMSLHELYEFVVISDRVKFPWTTTTTTTEENYQELLMKRFQTIFSSINAVPGPIEQKDIKAILTILQKLVDENWKCFPSTKEDESEKPLARLFPQEFTSSLNNALGIIFQSLRSTEKNKSDYTQLMHILQQVNCKWQTLPESSQSEFVSTLIYFLPHYQIDEFKNILLHARHCEFIGRKSQRFRTELGKYLDNKTTPEIINILEEIPISSYFRSLMRQRKYYGNIPNSVRKIIMNRFLTASEIEFMNKSEFVDFIYCSYYIQFFWLKNLSSSSSSNDINPDECSSSPTPTTSATAEELKKKHREELLAKIILNHMITCFGEGTTPSLHLMKLINVLRLLNCSWPSSSHNRSVRLPVNVSNALEYGISKVYPLLDTEHQMLVLEQLGSFGADYKQFDSRLQNIIDETWMKKIRNLTFPQARQLVMKMKEIQYPWNEKRQVAGMLIKFL